MMSMVSPTARAVLILCLVAGWFALGGQSSRHVPPERLDLRGYRLTFNEPFDRLDVSPWGPGTRWIAHTPWAGDFGDAQFTDPGPHSPFSIQDGILSITMRKVDGKWTSGLLASIDRDGQGFAQTTGYWEMRAKLPDGNGVWPAFWLSTIGKPGQTSPEIDALEYYGRDSHRYLATAHVWKNGNDIVGKTEPVDVQPGSLSKGYHLYGVKVERDGVFIYLDRHLVTQFEPRAEYLKPKAVLLNLAAGGGWPITGMPDPSVMQIDYVRAYQHAP
jgi:beta-glucanase (GH16 family)